MNTALLIEYDGSGYAGWQRQPNALTVQQVLEERVSVFTGCETHIVASGRTDAGVHALGQTANFHGELCIPHEKLPVAMNAGLPDDIRILKAMPVPEDFHARHSARGKHYRYCFSLRQPAIAIGRQYAYSLRSVPDIEAMQEAARYFLGEHDFKTMMTTGSNQKTTVRTIYSLDVSRSGDLLTVDVAGNGFLYNMVRTISGTLLSVGKGKLKPTDIPGVIAGDVRRHESVTLPANGLFLVEVFYENDIWNTEAR